VSWLDGAIHWRKSRNAAVPWVASYKGRTLELRLGDFPAEPLYTLVADGVDVVTLGSWPDDWIRTLVVRDERHGRDVRSLWAYVAPGGSFVIDGQDLGPGVERVFGEGIREYEWKRSIPAAEIPRVVEALEASPGTDVLVALETWLASHDASELESLIEERNVMNEFWSRAGD
jgi:hypothetical protein